MLVWGLTPTLRALERRRQEDCHRVGASLDYTARLAPKNLKRRKVGRERREREGWVYAVKLSLGSLNG